MESGSKYSAKKGLQCGNPSNRFLFFAFIFKLLFDFYCRKFFPQSHHVLSVLFQNKRDSNLGEEAQG